MSPMNEDHFENFQMAMRDQSRIDRSVENNEFLKNKIKDLKDVLAQALCCICDETPEDMTHEEARKDTISRIRNALSR